MNDDKHDSVNVVIFSCIFSTTTPGMPTTTPPPLSLGSRLTPDLERMDAFVIVGTAYPASLVNTSSCTGFHDLEKSSEGMTERSDWQRLGASSNESFVFSAHYDKRWRPAPLIQIIGIASTSLEPLFCRMWFRDSRRPVYSQASVQMIEDLGRRFGISS